jgi:hypothetical protein
MLAEKRMFGGTGDEFGDVQCNHCDQKAAGTRRLWAASWRVVCDRLSHAAGVDGNSRRRADMNEIVITLSAVSRRE